MALITRSYNLANGQTADAEQVDTDLDKIYAEFNGNIDNANIKAGAAIAYSKLNLANSIADSDLGALTGWVPANETWTYASATTFTISGDKTSKYGIGDKIKLTQTSDKYFYVTAVSHAAGTTTVTVTGGTDYSLANAAITSPNYSKSMHPQGFPQWFAWTPGYTGFSTDPSNTVARFTLLGRMAVVVIRNATAGTSNATSFTITGLPFTSATITNAFWFCFVSATDNGTDAYASGRIPSNSTTLTLMKTAGSTTSWTASGNKAANLTVEYQI